MSDPALTHHDIMGLVEPFARQGRHVDLAASDRLQRLIAFRPVDRAAAEPGQAPWRETLVLDCRARARYTLTRTLAPADGTASATLQASGTDVAELLSRIVAVPPERQFSGAAGYRVARSYDTGLPSGVKLPRAETVPPLVLTRAVLQVQGLTLALQIRLPGLRSVAADLTITPAAAARPALPEDLLAVLGWDWARLVSDKSGWTSKLRLRGHVLRRSRMAERALERAGTHLAQVMAEPPARFHERHVGSRWGVLLRRAIPSLTAVLMVVGALLLPRLTDPQNSGMWMALHYVPIALLAVAFSLQELAQFEIPPLPRKMTAGSWFGGEATSPDPTARA